MAKVFISYRRKDSQMAAGRLAQSLRAHFGEAQVFRDKESIQPGADWVTAIGREINSGGVMLALIGSGWSEARDAGGARRLDDPDDPNRQELVTALAAGAAVIPVLVEDARMPESEMLPEDLRQLSRRNALKLRDDEWDNDIRKMISAIAGCGVLPDAPQAPGRMEKRPRAKTSPEIQRALPDVPAGSSLRVETAQVSIPGVTSKPPAAVKRSAAALAGVAAVVLFGAWTAMQSAQHRTEKAARVSADSAAMFLSSSANASADNSVQPVLNASGISKLITKGRASYGLDVPVLENTANNSLNMEYQAIGMEMKKLSQMQEAQRKTLDDMDEQAKNAIRHIKGG
jgi:TIR domain